MTERRKMKTGLLYLAYNDKFIKERQITKERLFDFNNLRPSQEKKIDILKGLLGKTGKIISIESPFYSDYEYNICVGEKFLYQS